jgi:hypothetical protein
MTKPLIKRWVEALRSGAYRQTTAGGLRMLRRTGNVEKCGYCCLGVLAELVDPLAWVPTPSDMYNERYQWREPTEGYMSDGVLPHEWWDNHIGNTHDPDTNAFVDQSYLATRNDGGDDFSVIADMIERAYLS